MTALIHQRIKSVGVRFHAAKFQNDGILTRPLFRPYKKRQRHTFIAAARFRVRVTVRIILFWSLAG